ncbi:hypothetical protein VTH06DRAFT_1857 [Thermothelomyces fergusii]
MAASPECSNFKSSPGEFASSSTQQGLVAKATLHRRRRRRFHDYSPPNVGIFGSSFQEERHLKLDREEVDQPRLACKRGIKKNRENDRDPTPETSERRKSGAPLQKRSKKKTGRGKRKKRHINMKGKQFQLGL